MSGSELLQVIDAWLFLGKISPGVADYIKAEQSIRQALSIIGKESQLNAFRVSTYGINVD